MARILPFPVRPKLKPKLTAEKPGPLQIRISKALKRESDQALDKTITGLRVDNWTGGQPR